MLLVMVRSTGFVLKLVEKIQKPNHFNIVSNFIRPSRIG